MKRYFAPFKIKDFITLIITIVIGFTWIMISHYVLSQSSQRFLAFSVLIMLLLYLQYLINKPMNIWRYANTLSMILLIIVVLLSIVMHVIINNDFKSKILHLLLLCLITCSVPYIIALIYKITRTK
jgi:hypothetical protein